MEAEGARQRLAGRRVNGSAGKRRRRRPGSPKLCKIAVLTGGAPFSGSGIVDLDQTRAVNHGDKARITRTHHPRAQNYAPRCFNRPCDWHGKFAQTSAALRWQSPR